VHYIAPEQAMNSAMAVPQSDMYSLGIVLYEMLTGRVPFDDQSAMSVALKHLSDPPPPPRKYNPDISPELEAVVLRTLDKDPERRYADGNAFVQALETAFGILDEDEHTRRVVMPEWAKEVEKPAEPPVTITPEPTPRPDIPQPVIASGKDDTLAPRKPAPWWSANQLWKLGMIGGAALIVIGLLLMSGLGGGNSGTPIAVVNASPTTAAPTRAVVVAVDRTDVPTERPTSRPTTARSTAVDQPTVRPTTRPSAIPTNAPTARPALVGAAAARLVYDADMFLLINDSGDVMDLSGITFVQVVEEGDDLIFPTRRWNGGGAPIDALPPGDCFQIYTTNVVVGDTPANCHVRHKWDQTSFPRWFWISDNPDIIFEIRREDRVLAECRIGDGECVVDIPASSEDD
jgi:hypothetical protein